MVFCFKAQKKNPSNDELDLTKDQLKSAEINLATKDAEVIAAQKAEVELKNQIEEKKVLVDKLYKTIDEIGEYKSQTEKAINKHDEAILRHKNWWDKLTTNIQYQGKFNQEILENVLTAANLIKGRDFITETKHTTYDITGSDEKDVRPDVILKFPERNYVVDAKMSLTNWTDFILEKDENKKKEHLKKHLTSIRKHLFDPKTGLIKKNYNKLYGLKSLQSVIVFFPSDNLYNFTLDEDKDLLNDAIKGNFILTSPRELTNMIKLFEQIKSEKKQIENIGQIITLSKQNI